VPPHRAPGCLVNQDSRGGPDVSNPGSLDALTDGPPPDLGALTAAPDWRWIRPIRNLAPSPAYPAAGHPHACGRKGVASQLVSVTHLRWNVTAAERSLWWRSMDRCLAKLQDGGRR
jgi:hypothetical protein